MKVAFVADVHLGNHRRHGGAVQSTLNARCRAGLDVFARAVGRAVALGCAALVVAGDLFDTARPEPQLLAAVQRILEPFCSDDPFGFAVYVLVGNHDQTSASPGDHALGPLRGYATVIEGPQPFALMDPEGGPGAVLLAVPFRAGDARQYVPEAVRALLEQFHEGDERPFLLAIHAGVSDDATAPWLRDARDALPAADLASLCEEHRIEAAFAGNWHDRRAWGGSVPVQQVGALVPTGWDNPGLEGYGGLAVWDDGRVRVEDIPGPRFVSHKGTEAELGRLTEEARAAGHSLYVSWTVDPAKLASASAHVEQLIAAGVLAAGEVLPDDAITNAEARTAAHAARSSDTLDEALAAFVGAMPLAEGVDRADVLERSKGYLTAVGGAP